jgi:thiamine transport system ATP-binding protein
MRCDQVRFGYAEPGEMLFDFAALAGEFTAVMGPSGSGKSTLFALIAGFERPDSGRILIDGEDVTRLSPGRRPISHVFQENNLFAHLDVMTNVGLGIEPKRRLSGEQRTAVSEALARVGLAGFETRRPATLSGGERQRVALARALVRHRPVLLLDEPFAALGPRLRGEMLELVRALHREAALTTLMITHQPADARAIADRVLFLAAGKTVAHRTVAEIFESDDIPGWRDYLGSAAETGRASR